MKKNNKPFVHPKRHIVKTITWRIIGTLDTWLISWFLVFYMGEKPEQATEAASLIAGLELVTKTILYYIHERIWYNTTWISIRQRTRHIVKTFSWRLVGAADTILLVYLVYYIMFDSLEGAGNVAVSIFSVEIVTKMILYYAHERLWFISNWGVNKVIKG